MNRWKSSRTSGRENVADPATLLFYQAMGQHRLLKKDECLAAVSKLLEREAELPRRYVDAGPPDGSRHQAAQGRFARRDRPADGRHSPPAGAGPRGQGRPRRGRRGHRQAGENDRRAGKAAAEQQQQEASRQQERQAAESIRCKTASGPSSRAPAKSIPKTSARSDGWGNLPPKERQEVLQQIGRELPAHFRETIEEYFKRLAQDGVQVKRGKMARL